MISGFQTSAIVGCHRSGTTALANIINKHPNVLSTSELGTYTCNSTPCDPFLCMKRINNYDERVQDIGLHEKVDVESVKSEVCNPSPLDVLRSIRKHSDPKLTHYIDKYPPYTMYLRDIQRYVEKFIYLIRDPREVIESQIRNYNNARERHQNVSDDELRRMYPWTEPDVVNCIQPRQVKAGRCHNWLGYVKAWEVWRDGNVNVPTLELVYSQLPKSYGRIAEFLGVDAEPLRVAFQERFNTRKQHASNVGAIEVPKEWTEAYEKYLK